MRSMPRVSSANGGLRYCTHSAIFVCKRLCEWCEMCWLAESERLGA